MHDDLQQLKDLILTAAQKAREETSSSPEPELTQTLEWPIECTVGPGLEGAIACESKIGYVNGSKGWLIYRGYDIFDLCAHSTYEEVSYLLMHGSLPTAPQLELFNSHDTGNLLGYLRCAEFQIGIWTGVKKCIQSQPTMLEAQPDNQRGQQT